jgi:parallel beta-helix repeat protein
MAQGNGSGIPIAGIYINSAPTGTTITGNTINQQVSGGLNIGIYISPPVSGGANNITISGNSINILNTLAGTRGIFVFAAGLDVRNLTVSGNTITGCSHRGICLEQTEGFAVANFTINGNTVSGGSCASLPIFVSSATHGTVTGNTALAATTTALWVSASTFVRYVGNSFITTGTTAVQTAGTCTGSVFDESNFVIGDVTNGGTGVHVRQLGTTCPDAGTYNQGDVVYNTAGVTPFAWQCTGAGSPGAWTGLTLA